MRRILRKEKEPEYIRPVFFALSVICPGRHRYDNTYASSSISKYFATISA